MTSRFHRETKKLNDGMPETNGADESIESANTIRYLRDILAPGLRVVFCGINPGLTSAVLGQHFARRGNRFWKTIHLAGFTPEEITPRDAEQILIHRCGLTTAVARPTSRADELSRDEFLQAAPGLSAKIASYAPEYVAFLGKSAFAEIFGKSFVSWGPQADLLGGSKTWVLPNPSGLNRSFRLEELIRAYTELRIVLDEHSMKDSHSGRK